jgi:hypothetical protein
MELNIPNPASKDFCEAVGISPDRQQELSKALDAMVARLNSGPMKLIQMHHTFAEIASFCNAPEELVYCTVLHCAWHHRRGRILAPGPIDYDKIAGGIGILNDRLGKEGNCVHIVDKISTSMHSELCKQGAREGVQHLLDIGEEGLAQDIINRLTGYAF